ncbi:hypothetical protein P8C59_006397 [Phyllachora maydis]|uniref:Uncharacterized protein n=1 Tax=Phyllachora maydis TaxID=1825666 RepID=A0AAD9I684_9PEZI|nr:hypothetical protein P8C59_006397 [Phyllachora maydis]
MRELQAQIGELARRQTVAKEYISEALLDKWADVDMGGDEDKSYESVGNITAPQNPVPSQNTGRARHGKAAATAAKPGRSPTGAAAAQSEDGSASGSDTKGPHSPSLSYSKHQRHRQSQKASSANANANAHTQLDDLDDLEDLETLDADQLAAHIDKTRKELRQYDDNLQALSREYAEYWHTARRSSTRRLPMLPPNVLKKKVFNEKTADAAAECVEEEGLQREDCRKKVFNKKTAESVLPPNVLKKEDFMAELDKALKAEMKERSDELESYLNHKWRSVLRFRPRSHAAAALTSWEEYAEVAALRLRAVGRLADLSVQLTRRSVEKRPTGGHGSGWRGDKYKNAGRFGGKGRGKGRDKF